MRSTYLAVFSIFFSFFIAACGQTAQNTTPFSSSLDSSGNSLEQFESGLQGTWARSCSTTTTMIDGQSYNYYYKEAMSFTGVDSSFGVVLTDYFYSDPNCTSSVKLMAREWLSVLNVNANGSGWTYRAVVGNQTYAAEDSQTAALLNANLSCGTNQWVAGLSLNTTSTGCNAMGSEAISDTLYLSNGMLYRSLDEVANPTMVSGTNPTGAPYTKQL